MLPKITTLSKVIHLPIEDRDVRVYAFNVGEEKNLVVGKEDSSDELENKIFELMKNKVPDVNLDTLTIVDILVIFINLMDISKGVKQDLKYKCLNIVNGKECSEVIDKTVDISDYKIVGSSKNHSILDVTGDIKIELVYPSYKALKEYNISSINEEQSLKLFSSCIVCIYSGDDVINEFSEDEIYKWVLTFPSKFFVKVREFFESQPKLVVEYDVECPSCHSSTHYKVDNILDFFIRNTR